MQALSSLTLDEAFEGWLLDLRQRRKTPRTMEWYATVVPPFLHFAGVEDIQALSPDHLRRFALQVLAKKSPETQMREVGAIKTFGRWLEEQELLEDDPFRKVKKPRVDRVERRIVAPKDLQRILAFYDRSKPDQFRDFVMVNLTVDTGLRISEVCGAKLSDLDMEHGWLQVWGKGRKQRRVPVSPALQVLLWKWLKGARRKWATSDYLFVSRLGGPVDRNRLGGRFREYVRAAGIPHRVRYHDLRHAAATYALKAGMPKERVSRMLGHANDGITSIYEHLDFEDVQAAHSKASPLGFMSGVR